MENNIDYDALMTTLSDAQADVEMLDEALTAVGRPKDHMRHEWYEMAVLDSQGMTPEQKRLAAEANEQHSEALALAEKAWQNVFRAQVAMEHCEEALSKLANTIDN